MRERIPTFKNKKSVDYFKILNAYAQKMRENPTPSESAFFYNLLRQGVNANHIIAQKIVAPFIYDYYLSHLNLLVEINGSSHDGKEARDEEKKNKALSKGFSFISIPNSLAKSIKVKELILNAQFS